MNFIFIFFIPKKLIYNKTNAQKFKDAIEPSYDDAEDDNAAECTSGSAKGSLTERQNMLASQTEQKPQRTKL